MKAHSNIILCSGLLLSFTLLQNCVPVFSDLQSARLVGRGNKEITPSFTGVSYSSEEEFGGGQNQLGLQFAYGLTDRIDLRSRLEYIWVNDEDGTAGELVIAVGPKFSLIENRIAGYMPFMFSTGLVQLQPTMLFTVPLVRDKLDLNPSAKYIVNLCNGCGSMYAINVGLAYQEPAHWALRTEYGWMFQAVESGKYKQFSIGFSYTFKRKESK